MNIFWFRRDLRIEDNPGLFNALINGKTLGIFIFDTEILDRLENKADKRVSIIYNALTKIHEQFLCFGSSLKIYYGNPIQIWKELLVEYQIDHVFFNKDYEPYGISRDKEVVSILNQNNVPHSKYLDHLIFQPNEVLKTDKTPYTVFTPYSRKWKDRLSNHSIPSYPSQSLLSNLIPEIIPFPPIDSIGFELQNVSLQSIEINSDYLEKYTQNGDFPSLNHTSHLSVYLRFGLVSIRTILSKVMNEERFLNELIWREFYIQILFHFPHSASSNFKSIYDKIIWSTNEHHFKLWCEGKTGYPMVDAGMRELNETGLMHNRTRMIVACFLTKNLWIDWRWGEAYFAQKLLDFELSSNVGGWQWAASTGCDAVPYFRIFNPSLQQERFDKEFDYIKKWVPEFGTSSYTEPIVDYKISKEEAIKLYKKFLS